MKQPHFTYFTKLAKLLLASMAIAGIVITNGYSQSNSPWKNGSSVIVSSVYLGIGWHEYSLSGGQGFSVFLKNKGNKKVTVSGKLIAITVCDKEVVTTFSTQLTAGQIASGGNIGSGNSQTGVVTELDCKGVKYGTTTFINRIKDVVLSDIKVVETSEENNNTNDSLMFANITVPKVPKQSIEKLPVDTKTTAIDSTLKKSSTDVLKDTNTIRITPFNSNQQVVAPTTDTPTVVVKQVTVDSPKTIVKPKAHKISKHRSSFYANYSFTTADYSDAYPNGYGIGFNQTYGKDYRSGIILDISASTFNNNNYQTTYTNTKEIMLASLKAGYKYSIAKSPFFIEPQVGYFCNIEDASIGLTYEFKAGAFLNNKLSVTGKYDVYKLPINDFKYYSISLGLHF